MVVATFSAVQTVDICQMKASAVSCKILKQWIGKNFSFHWNRLPFRSEVALPESRSMFAVCPRHKQISKIDKSDTKLVRQNVDYVGKLPSKKKDAMSLIAASLTPQFLQTWQFQKTSIFPASNVILLDPSSVKCIIKCN